MLQIDARQAGKLRKHAAGEWLRRSFSGSPQSASVDPGTGDVLVSDPAGHATRFAFDPHGFIGAIRSPLGRTWQFDNDAEGKLLRLKLPSGSQVQNDYDATGQLSRVSRDSVPQYDLSYDASGQLRQVSFPDSTSVQFDYSATGQLIASKNRLGHLERYDRDEDGVLVSLQDANGNRTTFEYGELDRPERAVFADGTSEAYEYDENGYVCRIAAAEGVSLQITNDANGHPVSVSDGNGEYSEFEYDSEGRIKRATSPELTICYEYDGAGRVLREVQGEHAIEYSYDPAGTLIGIRYPDGDWVQFGYDPDMRLAHLRDWSGQSHPITYAKEDGRGYQIRLANGLITSVRQASTGFPTSISVLRAGRIRREVMSFTYVYDSEDRIRRFSDSDLGTRDYEYDAAGRLLEVKAGGNPELNEKFTYDAAGNRTYHNGRRSAYDNVNRLIRNGVTPVTYDGRGNLLTRDGWHFTYDSRNRLVAANRDGSERMSFGYDAFGRRIWKRSGSAITRYIWSGEQLIRETTVTESSTRSQDFLYFPGTYTPFATRIDGDVYFYHTDHLGTPRRLSDAAGQIVWTADFEAYGRARIISEIIVNPLRSPGQYYDEETGLHYNRFRYYAPELGRYISHDPLSFLAGLNTYAYCSNDPINFADPLGLINWKTVASVAAAVAVGIAVVALAPVAAPLAIIAAGVAAGAVGAGLNEALNQETLCIPCILRAAGKGALVGGIAALPFAILPAAAGVAAYAATGATSGGLGYVTDHLLGYPNSRWSWSSFGAAVGIGAATAGLGRYISVRYGTHTTSPAARQLARNRQAGIQGELKSGLIKNTQRIPSANPPPTYRIPDGLSQTTISEVKNVAKLSYSKQLRDYAEFARKTGRTFELYVRPGANGTKLSGPLQDAVRKGVVTLKFIGK
ncbi:MAG TPA: RHS repeat-associated core domain-containing protein [Longimicrobium sp.]|jgi:RHS repeat-associated protein|uniref:RHS repeat-associated core domain-containing protein n=1 Tax=Longimicrobium sp. TaxID=2029185 RepID=UPI002EDA0C27